jgi:Tfp pilus assembly protein PilF
LSLIADSLKKAVKEKSFDVSPGINLLKNLGSKAKPTAKFDPKDIKRFVILIVIPATILLYLLLAKPFEPNKISPQESPPAVAKAPAEKVKPIPQAAPKPPAPPPSPPKVPAKAPENIIVIEPGMKEVHVQDHVKEIAKPKPVAGPKKKSSSIKNQKQESGQERIAKTNPLVQEEPVEQAPAKQKKVKLGSEKILKPIDPTKMPKALAKASVAKTGKTSFPITPEPDIFKNSDYHFNRAIFYQQSRNWEKALTSYSKAAELDAKNPDIYNNMGVIYKELRQYDRAIDEFLRAIYLNPDYAKPYNNIGVVYYSKKDYLGAIRNYQKAISIEPKNLEALNNLSVAYKHTDQLDKSKAILNQALKINTDHAGTNYNLAVLFEKEGNQKSAIHFYQRFIDLGSTSHPALSTRVRKHVATLK